MKAKKGSKKLKITAHQQQVKDSEELSPHLTTTWTLLIKEIPLPTNKQGVSYQKTEEVAPSTRHFTPAPIELPIITGIST